MRVAARAAIRAAVPVAPTAARASNAVGPGPRATRGAAASAQPGPTTVRQVRVAARTPVPTPVPTQGRVLVRIPAHPHAPTPAPAARKTADPTADPTAAGPSAKPGSAGLAGPAAAQRGAGSAVTRSSTPRFGSWQSCSAARDANLPVQGCTGWPSATASVLNAARSQPGRPSLARAINPCSRREPPDSSAQIRG